jgi:hypothetical protein
MEWQTARDKADPTTEDTRNNNDDDEQPDFGELTKEEESEKDALLAEGFGSWNRREFNTFVKSCEVDTRTSSDGSEGVSMFINRCNLN